MFKIIGNNNNLGNKGYGIYCLKELGLKIPDSIIIEEKEIKTFKRNDLNINCDKYILRPSFNVEDGNKNSFASYFSSFFPLTKNELFKKLKLDNLLELFNGKGFVLKSVIIQEYIEAESYGVYFTRNPNNILEKGGFELGENNDGITSGKEVGKNIKLSFLQEKELELIGCKLEKYFKLPQDIEFCIKNNKIILLQTRSINTGNNTIYDSNEILKLNGIYEKVDFPEFRSNISVFTYSILDNIIYVLYLGNSIYFKKGLLFFNKNNIEILNTFTKQYKKYLIKKIFFSILKFFRFQKLDVKVLNKFYNDYNLSFDLFTNSNLNLNFKLKTNFITTKFLKLENEKFNAFTELEKVKIKILDSNIYGKGINYLKINEYLNNSEEKNKKIINYRNKLDNSFCTNKFFIRNGKIINTETTSDEKWIYKGKIKGKVVNIDNIIKNNNIEQILFIDDLSINIFEYLNYISGVVIKEGSIYSHNSIILRESKIISIIDDGIYTNFISENYIEIN